MKRLSMIILITFGVLALIVWCFPKKDFAEQTSQTSDIQLLARAINGEARGES